MKRILLLLLSIIMGVGLGAQSLPEKKQRWAISLSQGIMSSDENDGSAIDATSSSLFDLGTEYRLTRRFSLSGSLHHLSHRTTRTNELNLTEEVDGEAFYLRKSKAKLLGLSVGTRLNQRVGQGEFFAAAEYGVARLQPESTLVENSGKSWVIDLKNEVVGFQTVQLGYVYWPTKRIGLLCKMSLYRARPTNALVTISGDTYEIIRVSGPEPEMTAITESYQVVPREFRLTNFHFGINIRL